MRVVIIGCGLIGLTTAYFLRRAGHEVTVIDREDGPGRDTSFANGALLTPSMAEPWNAPGSWRVLLGSLGRSDSPLQLRLRALPGSMGWGITFLRNSKLAAFERNALSNLRLAMYSRQVLQTLRQQLALEYGRAARGSLRLFRDQAALDRASTAAARLVEEGVSFRRLTLTETLELEPALAPVIDQYAGSVHYGTDETGDAYQFCTALAEHARRLGVELRFRTEVSSLQMRAGEVAAVLTGQDRLVADRYIVAAGSYSTVMLRHIGVSLPVRPAKGYSITFDLPRHQQSLEIPVIDDDLHAAIVPLEGAIRVAGTAEFAGYDLTMDAARVRNLQMLVRKVLPQAPFDVASGRPWCGLRPMSADGVPIIGATPITNLFVNTGHGHLGWTMAAGSAQLLAGMVCGEPPSIDPVPYALARFRLE